MPNFEAITIWLRNDCNAFPNNSSLPFDLSCVPYISVVSKKYTPYLRHRSIVPLFYTYRQAHRRHDSYPCSPDRRPISSIHSVLMFCIPYHLFHLFLRNVEKAFFFIERTYLFHFLVIQSKSKNGNILLDIIEVRCSGNDREISLNMPAKNYLDGRLLCTCYLSDDRLNNAPLDIAPPNRNQQVM